MTTLSLPALGAKIRRDVLGRIRKFPGFRGLFRLQSKLIIPYVILTLMMAAVGVYVVTHLVTSTIRERFVNQLYESARVASDSVVRVERDQLENLRLMVFTEGVAQALVEGDADGLEALLLPLALNNRLDSVTALDSSGREILTLGRDPNSGQYLRTQATDFSDKEVARNVLQGKKDSNGDKYAAILETVFGPGVFTSSAVRSSQGEIVGAILVGTRLSNMLADIKSQALADLLILDMEKQVLATTLPRPVEGFGELQAAAQSASQSPLSQTYDLKLNRRDFQITYTPFKVRGEQIGWLGVVLPSSYVVAAQATSRNTFSILFTAGTLGIIVLGLLLSRSIARPILQLSSLTQAVAAGNLEQNIGLKRGDEIGELAQAFDVMTLRLRERTQEAARLYAEAIQRNKELAEINEQLRATQRQLVQSEKLAAIGQLTAGIVHDVKNPLTVIKGMAELLLGEDELPQSMREEITLIKDSAQKANLIVTDLLTFARQSKPELTERDMRETIEAALRLCAFPLRKGHIEVSKDLPEHPVLMAHDPQQIEQVLVNLITNAVQAMPNGGKIRINPSQGAGVIALAVQDTGIGIPPENINRIFDPFFTTKPEEQGTGLGLSVSYGIISNHDGRIEVESVVGEGTTFTILLPVKRGEKKGG